MIGAIALLGASAASMAQQLPVTDNTQAPFTGVFKDHLSSGDGIRKDNWYASWLGRSSVYATTFTGSVNASLYTWTSIAGSPNYSPHWKRWCDANPNNKIILGAAMLPGTVGSNGVATTQSGQSHARGARGDYDTYFISLATKIRDAGICDQVIVRLGWEFNGSWYPWKVQPGTSENDAQHFAANFCRISQVMRNLAPSDPTDPGKNPANLRFNWCGCKLWNSYNVGAAYPGNTPAATTSTGVSYPAYPGDNYVHSVGVDIYDTDIPKTTYGAENPDGTPKYTRPWSSTVLSTAWTNLLGGDNTHNGIVRWQTIADAHGKPMSFPEWGLSTQPFSSPNPAGGFDNPYFIEKMHAYIHNPVKNVLFHAYFDVSGSTSHRISEFPGEGATAHPNSAAKFRQLFTPPMPDKTNIGTITGLTKADGLNVVGAGAGYTGAADNFYFTSRLAGTNDVTQVKLESASVPAGQSGLMLRQNTATGSINAAIFVSNGNLVFQSRTTANGSTAASTVASGITYPIWLRLVRRGTAVTAYRSSDGLNWSYAAGQTLSALTGNVSIGVAVSSGDAATLNTVALDKLDILDIPRGSEATITNEILKDNDSAGVTFAGTWATQTTRTDRVGADYRIAAASAGTAATATYNPGVSTPGLYAVYVVWPTYKDFAFDVPITVNHASGSTPLVGNQAAGVGVWIYAGIYNLNSSSNVVITNSPTLSNNSTLADAVLFVPLPVPSGTPVNLAINPSFEVDPAPAQTITGWSESGSYLPAGVVEDTVTAKQGEQYLWHFSSTAYNLFTSQTHTGLANGTYTLKAWVQRIGAQTTAQMEANGFGGTTLTATIPVVSSWTQLTISGINVTNGTCTIGFRSVAPGNASIKVDAVEFYKN